MIAIFCIFLIINLVFLSYIYVRLTDLEEIVDFHNDLRKADLDFMKRVFTDHLENDHHIIKDHEGV